jgi:hypothetical protein
MVGASPESSLSSKDPLLPTEFGQLVDQNNTMEQANVWCAGKQKFSKPSRSLGRVEISFRSVSRNQKQVQSEALASTQSLDTRTGSSKILRAVCVLHPINKKKQNDETNTRSREYSAQRREDKNPDLNPRK